MVCTQIDNFLSRMHNSSTKLSYLCPCLDLIHTWKTSSASCSILPPEENKLYRVFSACGKSISQAAHVTACLHHQLWFCDAVGRGSSTQHPIPALVSHLPKLTINISSYYMATGRFPKTTLPIAQSKHFRECVQTEASNPQQQRITEKMVGT